MNRTGIIVATLILCGAYFVLPDRVISGGYLLWVVPLEAFLFGAIILVGHRVRPWWRIIAGAAFLSVANIFINVDFALITFVATVASIFGFGESASHIIAWFVYCGVGGIVLCFALDLLADSTHISWKTYVLCFLLPAFSALPLTHGDEFSISLHKILWFSLVVVALLISDLVSRRRVLTESSAERSGTSGPTKQGSFRSRAG